MIPVYPPFPGQQFPLQPMPAVPGYPGTGYPGTGFPAMAIYPGTYSVPGMYPGSPIPMMPMQQ